MNSKSESEYNKCSLLTLVANRGNIEWRKRQKDEKEKDTALEKRIINMRKVKTKESDKPADKRRWSGEEERKRVVQHKEHGEKRKQEES